MGDTLTTRFDASLQGFVRECDKYSALREADVSSCIHDSVECMGLGHPIDESLYLFVTEVVTKQMVGHAIYETVSHPAELCESPIELAMYFALLIAGNDRYGNVKVKGTAATPAMDLRSERLTIAPQSLIGSHRVDFLLRLERPDPRIRRTDESSGPRIVRSVLPESTILSSQLIIECDGHDFHEKTKEQASRDKSRDRALQTLGFKVFRFAGSDIWRDVFKCAEEAIRGLEADYDAALAVLLGH